MTNETADTAKPTMLRNIVHFAASNSYRHLLGFITALFRPTLLGPTLYGLWSLLNVVLMYTTFAHLGSRTAMRYQIPQLKGNQLSEVKQTVLLATFGINLFIALLIIGYALLWAAPGEQTIGWIVLAIVIVLNCVYEHSISELKGYQQFILVSRATYVRYTLNFVFTAGFIYYWGFNGAMAALLLGVLLSLFYLQRQYPLTLPRQLNTTTLRSLVKTGAPIMALDLATLALKSIDKLLIAAFLGAQSLGYYAIGSMLIGPLMNVPGASREVTEQVLMGQHRSLTIRQQLNHYLFEPLRFNAYSMPILIGIAYCTLPAFISVVLPQYQAALAPTQILIFGAFFISLGYPSRGLLVANKWQQPAAKLAWLTVILSALLIVAAIKLDYQLVGVALSSGLAFFVLFMISTLFILKRFKQPLTTFIMPLIELLLPFATMLMVLLSSEHYLMHYNQQWQLHPVSLSLIALTLFTLGYAPLLIIAYTRKRFMLPGQKAAKIDESDHELHFKIANGPYVACSGLPNSVINSLKQRYKTLATSHVSPAPNQADIVIKTTEQLLFQIPAAASQMAALYGFWLTKNEQTVQVYFFSKGVAVVRICFFDSQYVIEFIPRRKVQGRVNTALMFCLQLRLKQQDKLMTHGAAFSTAKQSFLLFGQRGIGKTQMSLQLLHQGWSYTGDDKFILHNGSARRTQNSLLLRDYHLAALSWLPALLPKQKKPLLGPNSKALLRDWIKSIVPERMLPNEDRLFNKGRQYTVEQLFPHLPVVDKISPNAVIILSYGDNISCHPISRAQAISQITLLQQLANAEFNPLEDFLLLNQAIKPWSMTDTLDRHFPDVPCLSLCVPTNIPIETLCKEIAKCLPPSP